MKSLVALGLVLCFAGCIQKKEDITIPGHSGGVSNFIIPSDGTSKPDAATGMTMTGPGCYALASCYKGCETSSNPSCSTSCETQAGSAAVNTFQMALGCAQMWCLDKNVTGGSNYKCYVSADQTQLVNYDGSAANPGTICGDCLTNATAALFLSSCTSSSSIDCNPNACQSERSACLNN